MSGSEVVKLYKSTDKNFFKLTASVYDKVYKKELKYFGVPEYENRANKKAVKSYKHVYPYINKKGKLSFIACIDGVPPDGPGYIRYDGSTKKYSVE